MLLLARSNCAWYARTRTLQVYSCLEIYDEHAHRMHVGFPLAVCDVLVPFQHAES